MNDRRERAAFIAPHNQRRIQKLHETYPEAELRSVKGQQLVPHHPMDM
jgi:hypothetical protein